MLRLYFPLEKGEAAEHNPAFLGQALFFALEESNRRLRPPEAGSGRLSAARLRRVSEWIRGAMDHCRRENIFREVFEFYSLALGNTSPAIRNSMHQALEPRIVRNLETGLAAFRAELEIEAHTPEEMMLLGALLGRNQEEASLGIVRYALRNSLILPSELPRIPLDVARLEEFRRRSERAGVDTAFLKPAQMEVLISRNRIFDELVQQVGREYGDSHPLVRGWNDAYFEGEEAEGRRYEIENITRLIKAYFAERH